MATTALAAPPAAPFTPLPSDASRFSLLIALLQYKRQLCSNISGVILRWQTPGLVGGVALLLVAHTVHAEGEDEMIRIISARKASRKERIRYDENRKKESLG